MDFTCETRVIFLFLTYAISAGDSLNGKYNFGIKVKHVRSNNSYQAQIQWYFSTHTEKNV